MELPWGMLLLLVLSVSSSSSSSAAATLAVSAPPPVPAPRHAQDAEGDIVCASNTLASHLITLFFYANLVSAALCRGLLSGFF